jgi:hypothetical protein
VPKVIPHNRPVDELMVATLVVLLLHVPPGTELERVTQEPTQTAPGPTIAPGELLMVTFAVTWQPDDNL